MSEYFVKSKNVNNTVWVYLVTVMETLHILLWESATVSYLDNTVEMNKLLPRYPYCITFGYVEFDYIKKCCIPCSEKLLNLWYKQGKNNFLLNVSRSVIIDKVHVTSIGDLKGLFATKQQFCSECDMLTWTSIFPARATQCWMSKRAMQEYFKWGGRLYEYFKYWSPYRVRPELEGEILRELLSSLKVMVKGNNT